MFERIKTILRNLFSRFRRSELPVVVRRIEYAGPTGDARHRHARPAEPHDARFDGIDPAEAAADIFAPSHGEQDTYRFSKVAPDGTVPDRAELWDRQNNSMRVRRCQNMLITGSGAVVSSPVEIRGICAECGEPESEVARCARCGAVVCQLHGYIVPPDPHTYCLEHAIEASEQTDTWAAYDIQHGLPPERSVYPERPWALAKDSIGGKRS